MLYSDNKRGFLGGYLERFKKMVPHDRKIKEIFLEKISQMFSFEIHPQEIRVVKNAIYLRVAPIKKAEILRRKKEIIDDLERKIGTTGISIQ